MSVVDRFPPEWLTSVTVIRGGGRDQWGDPQPVEEIEVDDCLVGWGSTTNPIDRGDVTEAKATLYRRRDGFEFRSTDRLRIPEGSMLPGVWVVNGEPKVWPTDVAVELTKDGA